MNWYSKAEGGMCCKQREWPWSWQHWQSWGWEHFGECMGPSTSVLSPLTSYTWYIRYETTIFLFWTHMDMTVKFSLSPSRISPFALWLSYLHDCWWTCALCGFTPQRSEYHQGKFLIKLPGKTYGSILSVSWRHLDPKLRLECSFSVLLPPYSSLSRNTD